MIGHALPVFQGYSSQYGHGLGNVLGGVFRAAVPFFSKLAKKTGPKLIAKLARKAGPPLLEKGIEYLQRGVRKRKAPSTLQKRATKRRKVGRIQKHKKAPPKKKSNRRVGRPVGRRKEDIFA